MKKIILSVEKQEDGAVATSLNGSVDEISSSIVQIASDFLKSVEREAGKEYADAIFNAIIRTIEDNRGQ